MFTGLIDDVGTIERVACTDVGREFTIRCQYDDLIAGESIAVNGACLTVRDHGPRQFTAAAITTTLGRTTMEQWEVGMQVNLERSLRMGDRMGGHIVQGHVDGVGTVVGTRVDGDAVLIDIELPSELFEVLVPHGSVTIDGVSLTVNELPRERILQISLIEYTLRHTTLEALTSGSRVHVENDVIGKYVQRLVAPYMEA